MTGLDLTAMAMVFSMVLNIVPLAIEANKTVNTDENADLARLAILNLAITLRRLYPTSRSGAASAKIPLIDEFTTDQIESNIIEGAHSGAFLYSAGDGVWSVVHD